MTNQLENAPSHHHGQPHADDLLATAEVALILRVPVAALRWWRHIRTGPDGFRLGRRVLYRRRDVTRSIQEQDAAEHARPPCSRRAARPSR